MAAKPAKGAVRKSKPIVAKTTLNNPYDTDWNLVVGDDMQFILKCILDKFEQVGLKKIEITTKVKKPKKPKKTKKNAKGKKKKVTENKSSELQDSKETQTEVAERPGWTRSDIRKQLAIGVNEVTRALEKNQLLLVLVCKSAKPPMITKHLIELSASRSVPACQLPRLSENIGPALGLKSVLALGFKKDSDVFLEEVKAVTPRVPPLNVSWLEGASLKAEVPADPPKEESKEEEDSSKQTASRKRKHSKSEAETNETGKIKLQGLKIKKIVANPNKIRKIKMKKKVSVKK
ncbi:ribonuclease P protein subunit p38 [Rhinophrynus dorsalis]